jgi:hypothetical protein
VRAYIHVEPEAARRGTPAIICRLEDGTVTRHEWITFQGRVTLQQRPAADPHGVKVWIEADTDDMMLSE